MRGRRNTNTSLTRADVSYLHQNECTLLLFSDNHQRDAYVAKHESFLMNWLVYVIMFDEIYYDLRL